MRIRTAYWFTSSQRANSRHRLAAILGLGLVTGVGLLADAGCEKTIDGDRENAGDDDDDGIDPDHSDSGSDGTDTNTQADDDDDDDDDDEDDDDDGESSDDDWSNLPKFDLTTVDLPDDEVELEGDPTTCREAAQFRTYVGCDFWPTVTFNPVLENFHFGAVVANGGMESAEVVVTQGSTEIARVTVEPGALQVIKLPWVASLKGPQFDARTTGLRPKESARADGGAYHLVSSVPVSVWQFNPLEYEVPVDECALVQNLGIGENRCLSVSNDAALLIPTTAMTGNYRVFLKDSLKGNEGGYDDTPASFAVTATQDGTTVQIVMPPSAGTEGGGGLAAIAPGASATFMMNEGDVIELLGKRGNPWEQNHDLSGAMVFADHPVQVIGTVALSTVPSPSLGGDGYADHLEETILPTEVLGQEYIVTPPTSSQGANIGHYVRLYGNFDGTILNYPGGKPVDSAPDTLNAGDVITLDVDKPFAIEGTESFAVGLFGRGGEKHTPGAVPTIGDPMFSMAVALPQYRDRYVFLAPIDYLSSYADITMPKNATATLDGKPLDGEVVPVEGTDWVVVRQKLGEGNNGVHRLEAGLDPSGEAYRMSLQVMGYGHATGYMYPGGLDLKLISDPVDPPK
jgi:hypothetical protein